MGPPSCTGNSGQEHPRDHRAHAAHRGGEHVQEDTTHIVATATATTAVAAVAAFAAVAARRVVVAVRVRAAAAAAGVGPLRARCSGIRRGPVD